MPAEIELKLAIDPGVAVTAATKVFRHPAVVAIRRGRVRTARVVSTYFDTPDWRLADAGIAVRLRRDGNRWLQTVKGPPLAQAGGALHARGEYEWPLAAPRLETVRLATTPWRRQLGDALAAGLASRFTTDVERSTLAARLSRRYAGRAVPRPRRDPRVRQDVGERAANPARADIRDRDRTQVRQHRTPVRARRRAGRNTADRRRHGQQGGARAGARAGTPRRMAQTSAGKTGCAAEGRPGTGGAARHRHRMPAPRRGQRDRTRP